MENPMMLSRADIVRHLAKWNQAWTDGGYGRYHTSSEPDSPGPWPFASLFVARVMVTMMPSVFVLLQRKPLSMKINRRCFTGGNLIGPLWKPDWRAN